MPEDERDREIGIKNHKTNKENKKYSIEIIVNMHRVALCELVPERLMIQNAFRLEIVTRVAKAESL